MPSTLLTIEQVLPLLRDVPTRIAALTADLSPEALQMRSTPEEWSAGAGAGPSACVCGRVGQLHHEDHRRGPTDVAGGQSPHLDQADGLS
jgi:hypothetical protein